MPFRLPLRSFRRGIFTGLFLMPVSRDGGEADVEKMSADIRCLAGGVVGYSDVHLAALY